MEPVGNTSVHAFPQNELPSKENVHLFKSQILSVSRLLSPKTNPWSQNSLVLLSLRLATRQCVLSRTSLAPSPQLLLSLSLWLSPLSCLIKACNIRFYFLQQALCAEGKYYAVTNDLHSMTCVCVAPVHTSKAHSLH